MLEIFIAPTNPSLSAGFQHASLGYNGKHVNHYTTEGDNIVSHKWTVATVSPFTGVKTVVTN
jgi:hypothetical protein